MQPKGYLWNKVTSLAAYQSAQNDPDLMATCQSAISYDCHSKEDVKKINEDLISVLTKAASLSLDIKRGAGRKRGKRKLRKNPWFDLECIKARIKIRQGCKKYCKTPLDSEIRLSYYTLRKAYRKLISHKKNVVHANINKEIEDSKEIRWENFKKPKAQKCAKEDDMDIHDIANFYKFFQDLYRQ
jgi:hypothetical protein